MTPWGIVAVAALAIAMVVYRWWVLSRTGEFDERTEWRWWLFAAGMILVSIIVTVAGRTAMLVLTPIILIPSGVYLIYRSATLRYVGGMDLRFGGWLAIVSGTLGGLAALAELWARP